jgi:hypothetical protein
MFGTIAWESRPQPLHFGVGFQGFPGPSLEFLLGGPGGPERKGRRFGEPGVPIRNATLGRELKGLHSGREDAVVPEPLSRGTSRTVPIGSMKDIPHVVADVEGFFGSESERSNHQCLPESDLDLGPVTRPKVSGMILVARMGEEGNQIRDNPERG